MVLVHEEVEVATWPLEVEGRLDLVAVDDLARLQLAARDVGCSIRLRRACPELLQLLDLTGLADAVPAAGLVQVGREAERLEQPGVEEVVVPDDPVA